MKTCFFIAHRNTPVNVYDRSVAFPLISAGTYGYPKDEAMSVALDVISKFLFENDMLIYLVVFGRTEYLTSKKLFSDVQEYIDDIYAVSHYERINSDPNQDSPIADAIMDRIVHNAYTISIGGNISMRERHGLHPLDDGNGGEAKQ